MTEKPPILRGSTQDQVAALRDYLFRLAKSLDEVTDAESLTNASSTVRADGSRVYRGGKAEEKAAEDVRKNAEELKSLIIKNATELEHYCDRKVEEYTEQYYVSSDQFGEYTETVKSTIETTAKGVVDSYNYNNQIESMQADIGSLESYYTLIDGEIKRGIVWDPSTNQYVTGIAISQHLRATQKCGSEDPNNPQDGYTYYYIDTDTGQTFGLYTSTGWQFWIDGQKKGWFNSQDGMLHVANIVVENTLQIGANWAVRSSPSGNEFEILYTGVQ